MSSNDPQRLLRVLHIEDVADDAELVAMSLKRSKRARFEVEVVPRLESARRRLSTTTYNVVLLDLGLPDSPDTSSISALRAITASPIVVLTGDEREEIQLAALNLGAQDIVVKSRVSNTNLDQVLIFAVERHRAQRSRRMPPPVDLGPSDGRHGPDSLLKSDPLLWAELVAEYRYLLERRVESRVYRVEPASPRSVRELAIRLATVRATPHDVTELHSAAGKSLAAELTYGMKRALPGESLLVLVHVFGELVAQYRSALPAPSAGPQAVGAGPDRELPESQPADESRHYLRVHDAPKPEWSVVDD